MDVALSAAQLEKVLPLGVPLIEIVRLGDVLFDSTTFMLLLAVAMELTMEVAVDVALLEHVLLEVAQHNSTTFAVLLTVDVEVAEEAAEYIAQLAIVQQHEENCL